MNNKLFCFGPAKRLRALSPNDSWACLLGPGLAIMHQFLLYPCIVSSMLDISSLSLALLDPGAALSHACYSQSFYVDIRYGMPDPNDLLSETKIETKLQRALMKHNLQNATFAYAGAYI